MANHSNILAWKKYPVDRGAWRATVHWVSKSRTWLKQLSTYTRWAKCEGKGVKHLKKKEEEEEGIKNQFRLGITGSQQFKIIANSLEHFNTDNFIVVRCSDLENITFLHAAFINCL